MSGKPKVKLPTPEEFFNQVIALKTVTKVRQACNDLLSGLESYTPATISKKLSAYRKLFYEYQSNNSKLNETVDTTQGKRTQHIAGKLLALSPEQAAKLKESRQTNEDIRAGYDAQGNIREVNKPPIDIAKTVKQACEYLNSNNSQVVASGILILTGLRANELLHLKRKLDDGEIVERNIEKIGEYKIAVLGVSKKKNKKEGKVYLRRYCLAPADLIIEAYQKIKNNKELKAIGMGYKAYDESAYRRSFTSKFKDLFGDELSTIISFNDNGKRIDNDGTPHKARAFYACTLRAILRSQGTRNATINRYVQLCLNHETTEHTAKYLNRFDDSEFINPINITLEKNIRGLGMTTTLQNKKLNEINNKKSSSKSKKADKNEFSIDKFIEGISSDMQIKFQDLIDDENLTTTEALITLVNFAEKHKGKTHRTSVSDIVAEIVDATMRYNSQCPTTKERVKPSYAFINRVGKAFNGRQISRSTVEDYLKSVATDLNERLINFGIIDRSIQDDSDINDWNAKYHRRDMDEVVNNMIVLLNM